MPEIKLHLAAESLPIWQKTEEQLGKANAAPPFWAFAWAGGQALSRYILDHPQLVAGKDVQDLGAGSGIVGISARKAGARSVLAVDIDTMALAAVQMNAAANAVEIATAQLNLVNEMPPACDVLLIADLFYERELAAAVRLFVAAAKGRGTLVFAGDPERSYFPREAFEQVAEYRVPVTRDLEDADIKLTRVWRAL